MNIGIFSDTYFPQLNGVATSIRTLTHALREKGHTVYIFTPSDPRCEGQPEDEDIFRLPSIPVYFVRDYRAGYIFPPHILKKIKKLNLDIVHTQTEFPLGFLGKLVSTTEGIISKNMAREFSSAFCNTAMAVIAPTHKTEQLLSGYGVTKPISIIPTGINTAHFRKENFDAAEILALRKSLGLKADTPVIISIGRIAKEKSIDVVISALPKLIEKLPEVQMVIVGEGNEIENLRNFAESIGVGAHVMFTGGKPWDEIGKYYQLGNVFCSASVSETQGLTFAEAMAGGIPVVAKKDECIENIITDGETGMLFEKNEDLPELLYRVLTDKALSEKLSTASIQAMDVLSVQNFADSVEQLYQNILEQEERPKPIAAPVIPFVIGAKAAKGITGLPGKISRTYLKKAANFLSSAKGE